VLELLLSLTLLLILNLIEDLFLLFLLLLVFYVLLNNALKALCLCKIKKHDNKNKYSAFDR